MRRSTAITKIDEWFIDKIAILVEMEQALKTQELTVDLLKEAKTTGVPGQCHRPPHRKDVRRRSRILRYENSIVAAYKMVDTCAAEFEAETPYYYSVFGRENEAVETSGQEKSSGSRFRPHPYRSGYRVRFLLRSLHLGILQRKAMRPSSSTTTRRP